MPQYYFAIASKKFLVDAEPIEEILRERSNHYKSINKDIDFWFTTNPQFIHLPQFEHIKKKLKNNPAAIISLDEQFIEWIKLRINFVITGKFHSSSF
uniref:Conserved hypothetical plastid protein n=1 Tax=Caulacanthus okamurae TaxID=152008 RepID=A0A6H1U956_9FLOR|nr:conserved hypothetical plastid protein [Caulacanthus okamurae]QIZ74583.1 conserved hypothetical plastid protein [Caulacanthus okamurae]